MAQTVPASHNDRVRRGVVAGPGAAPGESGPMWRLLLVILVTLRDRDRKAHCMPPVAPGVARARRDRDLGRVRFRRALTLMLMTLLVPGSAQLAAGRRSLGRVALRAWLGLVAACLVLLVVGLLSPGTLLRLFSSTRVLTVVRLLLCAVAVAWAGLFVDAWRLGHPLELRQRQRLAMVGLNGVLCFSVAGTLLFASHVVAVQRDFLATMFGHTKVTAAHAGRYNILLLGGDSGPDRWGLRTDSINVASVDAQTGRAVLFGLPRNMMDFPFPKGSIMARQFPDGYNCDTCELNSLSTWAGDHLALFKGVPNPGMAATIEGVEGITGLKINYWAMVNMQGFRDLVDAVGGITLDVRDTIPIGGVGGPITGYIKPGVRRLDGFHALWFARSRATADDYSRMARQKCVMNAMLHQLSPSTVITRFQKIEKASEQLIDTSLPASELSTFAQLALKARSQPVSTVSFVPPAVDTSHPDIATIRAMIKQALTRPSGKPGAKHATSHASVQSTVHSTGQASTGNGFNRGMDNQPEVGGSIGDMSNGYAANKATDLSSVC
jgi:polyisoprenyl-teichoic acid--peptidoglycan teichoic acid transferase